MKVALTGGIACGKSLAAEYLEAEGCRVLDTDHVAHAVMRQGGAAYASVVECFGNRILDRDGEIDRKELGALVFSDGEALGRLNASVHPHVRSEVKGWLADASEPEISVVVVPLLYETSFELDQWDSVICIYASRSRQVERLRTRGWSEEECQVRIDAQLTCKEKATRADRVVVSNHTKASVQRQIQRLLKDMVGGENG